MINVLIADSHPAARRVLLSMVERLVGRLGQECFVAFGEDAITTFRKAKRLQPDLILLSAPLPFATGVQVVAALREHTPNAKLAILLDDKDSVDPDRYSNAGADVVLLRGENTLEIEAGLKALLVSNRQRR
jgi:DNA-binding NarL/FixJ family response regulator